MGEGRQSGEAGYCEVLFDHLEACMCKQGEAAGMARPGEHALRNDPTPTIKVLTSEHGEAAKFAWSPTLPLHLHLKVVQA